MQFLTVLWRLVEIYPEVELSFENHQFAELIQLMKYFRFCIYGISPLTGES